MSRVAVCIGVDAPGLLAPLRSCAKSAEEFGKWLKSKQDFDDVRILTDVDRSKGVDVTLVKQAIKEVLNAGPTQCVVYVSGHGLVNGGSETSAQEEAHVGRSISFAKAIEGKAGEEG